MWLDESRLAVNIASRSFRQLMGPLAFDQLAPVPFLWIERAITEVLGVRESALRLAPLLAGTGMLILVWYVGKALLSRKGAAIATLYCATSPTLIAASAEVKQYTFEACVTCALMYAAVAWLEGPNIRRRWLVLLAAGVVGVWLTPTAAFVLCGMVLAVGFQRGADRLRRIAMCTIAWVVSGLLAYRTVYSNAADSVYIHHYWTPAFLVPGRPGVLLDSGFALRALVRSPVWRDSFARADDTASIALAVPTGVCLILIATIGVRSTVRKWGPATAGLLVGPPLATLLGSVLGRYPLSARTTMFFLPIGLTVLAAGMCELASHLRQVWLVRTVPLLPVALFVWFVAGDILTKDRREDVKPLIRQWTLLRKPGEPIYVLAGAIPAWAFYSTDWQAPDWKRLKKLEDIGSSTGSAFENASRWPGPGRDRELMNESPHGLELYGASSGLEAHAFGLRKAMPSPGWAESEAQRMRAAAGNGGVWLLLAHYYGPEGQLLDALRASGGYETLREGQSGAALLHFVFP